MDRTLSTTAFAALAALDNPRALMMAAPRCWTVEMNSPLSHASSPMALAAALPLGWDEPIYIPDPAKRVPLRSFEPSLPTLFFLNRHDFWVAGDLHGRSYPGLRMKSGCDLGIISELRRLVDALQQAHGVSPADIREERQQEL